MKTFSFAFVFLLLPYSTAPKWWTMNPSSLEDRIAGAWAGQVIGASVSEHETAFAYADSSHITAASPIAFQTDHKRVAEHLNYDLLLVEAFCQKQRSDFSSFFSAQLAASAITNTHALTTAKKMWKQNVKQPWSGKWVNNPHAHDPDFARGAEVLGLLYPGMPRPLERVADAIGHLSNSGDGYYAGIFLATLTSLGFVINDPERLVREALKAVPVRTEFHRCITEVVNQYNTEQDWLPAWKFIERKWKKDTGCPTGSSIHDDGRMYAAFATFVYLYGESDIRKCINITREIPEGIDVLPAVLSLVGTTKGFDYFPDDVKSFVSSVRDVSSDTSLITLQQAIDQTVKEALLNVEENGGKVKNNGQILIPKHSPSPASHERTFQGHYISKVHEINAPLNNQFEFEFEGVGFVLLGKSLSNKRDTVFAELYLNHKYVDRIILPEEKSEHPVDLCWQFQLTHNKYKGKLRLLQRDSIPSYEITKVVVYDIMAPASERQLR